MKKQFTQLLQGYLNKSGIKRVHIASVAGISYNYLTRLISGTRNPSEQVVYNLAQAFHLSGEQTAELLSSAGFAPSVTLIDSINNNDQATKTLALGPANINKEKINQINRVIQQFYLLAQDVPDTLQSAFLEELRCLLGYAKYKYLLSNGTSLLDLSIDPSKTLLKPSHVSDDQASFDIIAQIVGELHLGIDETAEKIEYLAEDTMSTIDHLIGNLLAGEISAVNYQPHLIAQTLDILRNGAPWEIRRRITEALPSLCRLDAIGAERLMESLRLDFDGVRGADIRRRVIEALPTLFDASPEALPSITRLLQFKSDDDIYVALATAEACGDIQVKAKSFLLKERVDGDNFSLNDTIHPLLPEIARIQRQLLMNWDGIEQERLKFSIELHNLLSAPDTLLISLSEGLRSSEKLIQLVTVRYLERILPVRPLEALKLYQLLLRTITQKNVRRPVAKALPGLLQCLKETSLSTRALARSIILSLADDPDIPIRRAVADHAMQIFYIDREFLLVLLRQMHKETDQAIRHRLRPVALRLAQVWLVWYAETAGLVPGPKRGSAQAIKQPFGD